MHPLGAIAGASGMIMGGDTLTTHSQKPDTFSIVQGETMEKLYELKQKIASLKDRLCGQCAEESAQDAPVPTGILSMALEIRNEAMRLNQLVDDILRVI